MNNIKNLGVFIIMALLAGCVSAPQPPEPASTPGPATTTTDTPESAPAFPPEMELMGAGTSESLLGSMQGSKADAIRKGVIEIIGPGEEEDNYDQLNSVLYSTKDTSAYVKLVERTRKDKIGNDYIYEGIYLVQLNAIEATLKAHGIIMGSDIATSHATELVTVETGTENIEIDDPDYDDPTSGEKKFIARYVDQMTFLVYFDDNSRENPDVKRGGLSMANEYIISKGLNTIDLDQVEEIKEDQQAIYEEETGESMSIIQWIAQKLNADIYIEIAGSTGSKNQLGGKFYGTANVTLKAFESSTGDLVGSVAYNLPENKAAFSKISVRDARMKAMEGVIYTNTMPRLIEQIKNKMQKTLLAGIKYDVIVQSPPNDREMSKFWKDAKRRVKSYKTVYQAEDEVKYSVWFIGGIEELKEVFYDASEGTDLEDMYAVAVRGKSITFNSGL